LEPPASKLPLARQRRVTGKRNQKKGFKSESLRKDGALISHALNEIHQGPKKNRSQGVLQKMARTPRGALKKKKKTVSACFNGLTERPKEVSKRGKREFQNLPFRHPEKKIQPCCSSRSRNTFGNMDLHPKIWGLRKRKERNLARSGAKPETSSRESRKGEPV